MRKQVYRLENSTGHGPFHGDQSCVKFLRPHADPELLLKMFGYPKEVLSALSKAGFVFGWRTRKDYNTFFKSGGQTQCKYLGFELAVYTPEWRFDLPDGQVLFARKQQDVLAASAIGDLLKALSSMRRVDPKFKFN